MANTNCLEGIRCPQCQQEDAFRIEAQVTVHVTDEGTEDQGGDYAWEDGSPCRCVECGHAGKLEEFQIKNQSAQQEARIRDAAPELLYALEKLVERDRSEAAESGFTDDEMTWLEDARRAIAKAKGGAA